MSDGVKLWCFLLLIPFFAAIGHDIYANYMDTEEKKTRLEAFEIDPTAYQGSDLGYLATKYTPAFYDNARAMIDDDIWVQWVDPVLRLYSFVVALVPAVLFFIWLLIARIFDIWPFSSGSVRSSSGRSGGYKKTDGSSPATFKYKRR